MREKVAATKEGGAAIPTTENSNAWVERQEAHSLLPQASNRKPTNDNADIEVFKLGLKDGAAFTRPIMTKSSGKYVTQNLSPEKE
mmetsp:Transcript_18641/g.23246  ORF Transcript_18641/g.23246 Transcript_18641/m.23246 type:complete len:85 (-) Transcript_18641:357-611(-)